MSNHIRGCGGYMNTCRCDLSFLLFDREKKNKTSFFIYFSKTIKADFSDPESKMCDLTN